MMRFMSFAEGLGAGFVAPASLPGLVAAAHITPSGKLVFLSHSTRDDPLVPGAIALMAAHGASVYADDFDKRLPTPPNVATADILKAEIDGCPRLVVIVTVNSRHSRWIPWELGLGDGLHRTPPNALLPITEEGLPEPWLREEYFELYPKIMKLESAWSVVNPRNGKVWTLPDWLHNPV